MSDKVSDPNSYNQTWTRGADGSFNDIKKEKFATFLAGGKTMAEAARLIGLTEVTGRLWAKNDDMKDRKRILRATPAISQTFVVSIAMIVSELHRNAQLAREENQFKASNDALLAMYEIAKNEKSLLETFTAAKGESLTAANVVDQLRQQNNLVLRQPVAEVIDATPQPPTEEKL
jgi:hypothetical protein